MGLPDHQINIDELFEQEQLEMARAADFRQQVANQFVSNEMIGICAANINLYNINNYTGVKPEDIKPGMAINITGVHLGDPSQGDFSQQVPFNTSVSIKDVMVNGDNFALVTTDDVMITNFPFAIECSRALDSLEKTGPNQEGFEIENR